ncbi:hypothetical protein ACFFRR_004858 [Megaselia abdita]
MTTIADQVSSYDTAQKPFIPDSKRGKWAMSGDYFFACISNVFNSTHFSNVAYLMLMKHQSTTLTFIYYLLCSVLYVLPLIFIQSFLGQFSSSGYISVFRIAPLFKGLGYVIFLLNFVVLGYAVLFAAVPLFYTVTSTFALTNIISCNNTWNSQNCTIFEMVKEVEDIEITPFYYSIYPRYSILAAHEYYNEHLHLDPSYYHSNDHFKFNWPIFICAMLIWCLIGSVMSCGVERIGRFNRYISISLMITLLLFVIRAFTVADLIKILSNIFDFAEVDYRKITSSLALSPLICFQTFGRGWGTPLVMASHNNFKAKVHYLSLATVVGSILLTLASTFVTVVFYGLLSRYTLGFHFEMFHPQTSLFVAIPSVFGAMAAPRTWLFLFFLMITLSEISSIVLQLSGLMTSFFDEFDEYRKYKDTITHGIILFLSLQTIFYCSNKGFEFFQNIMYFQIFSQALIFMFLLLIVMWVYGRKRFQRDILFMLDVVFHRTYSAMIRFVTPFLIFIIGASGFLMLYHSEHIFNYYEQILAFTLKYIPWLIFPGYMIFRIATQVGSFANRFTRLCKPTDWYPVDGEERHRYESTLGDTDMAHQLAECTILNENSEVGDE